MWQIPFFDRIWILNIIRFFEITEYRILNTIRYLENSNTESYLVSRKSEYLIQIVLFGPTIGISNTKYQIIYNILEKMKLKKIYFFHTIHFVLQTCETIWTGIRSNYSNTWILLGVQKKIIPNTDFYLVLRKSEYPIRILLFSPTIRILFEYQIIHHTLSCLFVPVLK